MSIPIHEVTKSFITTRPSSRSVATRASPQSNRPHDTYPSTAEKDKIRIVCLSDTHSTGGWDQDIPDGDVLIHAGDLTRAGSRVQIIKVYQELLALPHKIKLVIAGNHDLGLDPVFLEKHAHEMKQLGMDITKDNIGNLRDMWRSKEAIDAGIIFMEHERHTINVRDRSLSVFGSSYSPEFLDWAFMYPEADDIWSGVLADPKWSRVTQADILITHGPPKGYLDEVPTYGSVGCPYLAKHLSVIQPLLHVFGHIHEGASVGLCEIQLRGDGKRKSVLVNASLLDERYRLVHRPTVIDL